MKNILFFLCFFFAAFSLEGSGRFFHRGKIVLEDRADSPKTHIEQVFTLLDKYSIFWHGNYGFAPRTVLKITVMPSVAALQKLAGVHHLIGGWYTASGVFIQPLAVLRKVGMLEKVLFIELSHYYIQEYTLGNCPGWWDELMALDGWHLYEGSHPAPLSASFDWDFAHLSRLASFVGKKTKSRDFFSFLENFAFFLKKKYSPSILLHIMERLRRQVPLEEAFYARTGARLDKVYEDFKAASRHRR